MNITPSSPNGTSQAVNLLPVGTILITNFPPFILSIAAYLCISYLKRAKPSVYSEWIWIPLTMCTPEVDCQVNKEVTWRRIRAPFGQRFFNLIPGTQFSTTSSIAPSLADINMEEHLLPNTNVICSIHLLLTLWSFLKSW